MGRQGEKRRRVYRDEVECWNLSSSQPSLLVEDPAVLPGAFQETGLGH